MTRLLTGAVRLVGLVLLVRLYWGVPPGQFGVFVGPTRRDDLEGLLTGVAFLATAVLAAGVALDGAALAGWSPRWARWVWAAGTPVGAGGPVGVWFLLVGEAVRDVVVRLGDFRVIDLAGLSRKRDLVVADLVGRAPGDPRAGPAGEALRGELAEPASVFLRGLADHLQGNTLRAGLAFPDLPVPPAGVPAWVYLAGAAAVVAVVAVVGGAWFFAGLSGRVTSAEGATPAAAAALARAEEAFAAGVARGVTLLEVGARAERASSDAVSALARANVTEWRSSQLSEKVFREVGKALAGAGTAEALARAASADFTRLTGEVAALTARVTALGGDLADLAGWREVLARDARQAGTDPAEAPLGRLRRGHNLVVDLLDRVAHLEILNRCPPRPPR